MADAKAHRVDHRSALRADATEGSSEPIVPAGGPKPPARLVNDKDGSAMSTARKELNALAIDHGLTTESLTLIKEATLPTAGERLSDTEIGFVLQAVETCLFSGLTNEQIEPVIREHKARAPDDWRERFWRERLALAAEHETKSSPARAAPERRLTTVPVAPIPPQPPSEIGPGSGDPHDPLAA